MTAFIVEEETQPEQVPEREHVGFIQRVLFAPVVAWPIAIARVLLGLTCLGWAISMMFDVSPLLSPDGPVPLELASLEWALFELATERSVWIALVVIAVCAISVTVGFKPTPFLLVAFFLLVSVQRRNPLIVNSGDLIMTNLLFLLALSPSSAAFSVDRWRRHGRSSLRTAPLVAPLGMRLIQLQMMVAYFVAFWSKSGALWTEGVAVSTVLRLENLRRFTPPSLFRENILIAAVTTWGTLALELALAMFLWNRRARPFLIGLGVLLHLFIDAFMLVGFFSVTMFAGLFTFLNGENIQKRINSFSQPAS